MAEYFEGWCRRQIYRQNSDHIIGFSHFFTLWSLSRSLCFSLSSLFISLSIFPHCVRVWIFWWERVNSRWGMHFLVMIRVYVCVVCESMSCVCKVYLMYAYGYLCVWCVAVYGNIERIPPLLCMYVYLLVGLCEFFCALILWKNMGLYCILGGEFWQFVICESRSKLCVWRVWVRIYSDVYIFFLYFPWVC